MAIGVAVWWCCGCVVLSEVGVLPPALKNRKKPHKPKFTGQRWGCGGGTGLVWPLVWPFVGVADMEGGCHRFVVLEYTSIKKSPVNKAVHESFGRSPKIGKD